jgi:CheY-like chemotaxis protein
MSACQKDAHGNWERQVGVFSDITERKRVEQELREAGRRKDEFLAMLAHELRNPLAPISAAAELLRLGRTDETWIRQASAIITRQVSHMTGLVDDLLDVSRVTRGLVTLERTRLDAKRIIFDAVEQTGPLIEARRHHLSVHTPPEPIFVLCDQKRLVQVLTNLLSNAAKYTPDGGKIVLDVEPHDGHVKITVTDNGIGMTQELVDRAFELFAQAECSSDRSQGGLGIGLALVKSLVSLHGGTVSAASEGLGKGSRFTVCLPHLKAMPEDAPGQRQEGFNTVTDKPLKVLVLDDNADAAQMLSMLVRAMGHRVAVEHSSRTTLERVRQEQPDVCLLDIGLPDMDGNELARRIRAMPEMAHAVLVAVTGYGQEADHKHALEAGFDHHLVKPVDTKQLVGILAAAGTR